VSGATLKHYSDLATDTLSSLDSIDGVLKSGETVLSAATRTIDLLEGNNPLKKKVPYIFITNGGGVSEKWRAELLSKQFKVKVRQSPAEHSDFSLSEPELTVDYLLDLSEPSHTSTHCSAVTVTEIW
jgi:ribonucleotide monophosphatase NagD (HAD superfamily)